MKSIDEFLNIKDKNGNNLINLDESQLEAVKTETNAIVTAGAGSGKTYTLAYRFAYMILTEQAKVDQILTLTFTKKAAAEMYGRIYKKLKEISKSNINDYDRNLVNCALKDFDKAHIQN